MAFVDIDDTRDRFANITQFVGPGRANRKDDVALVQILLTLHFSVISRRTTKVDPAWLQLGAFDWNTGQLISEFQKNYLKRPKPEGYIKTAVGKNKHGSTIVQLNNRAHQVLAAIGDPRDLLTYLRSSPILAPSLQVITVPTITIK